MNTSWFDASSDWQDALWTAATVFLGLSALQVLMWGVSLEPVGWKDFTRSALLGGLVGLTQWGAPRVGDRLHTVSPEQLRVTLAALFITAGFFGMSLILSVGESGSFLKNWPLFLALFLPMGFVLAIVGALGRETGDPDPVG